MFTFYNFTENKEWNFCYNERMAKWITRYSWTPLYSENINNSFYSLDKKRAEILSYIYDNRYTNYGIFTSDNQWKCHKENNEWILNEVFSSKINYIGHPLSTDFKMSATYAETSYLDDDKNEITISVPTKLIHLEKGENEYIMKLYKSEIIEELGFIPMYFKIDTAVQPICSEDNTELQLHTGIVSIIVDEKYNSSAFDELLCNGFYIHGRAGIIDEIDYFDDNPDNQIKPTYWYNKQEPFEFEFVVAEPIGAHKIFNNLMVISNNAEPDSFEFEIIGDVYDFKKSGEYKNQDLFKNIKLNYDHILNQYTLIKNQKCKNIEKVGRRLGNIQYKEDSWYSTIEPIIFKNNSARIRDKFIKIRVKYSGKDHVIVTALKTLFTLSYS